MKSCLWLSFVLLLLCSCSSPVSISHYSIEYFPKNTMRIPMLTKSVGLESFSSVGAIQRSEIVTRIETTNKIEFSTDNFWWTLPREIITESFRNFLDSKKLFIHVLPYPTLHEIDYVITGKIHRFEIQKSEQFWRATIAIDIKLINAKTQEILWQSGLKQQHTQCSSQTMESAAEAMEKNIEKTYDSIFEKLSEFLGQKSD